jgi:ABC-2 type transport system permease protein
MMNTIKRFFSQAWLFGKATQGPFDFLEFISYKLCYSLLSLCFYCIVASYAIGVVDLTRWVVGNAFTLCVIESINNLGIVFTFERQSGRLRSVVASPTNNLTVVIESGMFSMLISFATVAVGFILGGLIFGVSFVSLNIPMFIVSMLAATFAAAGFGLLLSVISLVTDSMYLILNAMVSLVIILSGANFPVTQLPVPVQYLSRVFPLNHAIQAAAMCFGMVDVDGRAVFSLIGREALNGAVYFLAAYLLLKFFGRIAVKRATLEMF